MWFVRVQLIKLSCVAIFLINTVNSSSADVLMRCDNTLYKYESNFFGTDEIKVRIRGIWKPWCSDGRLEKNDYSANCWLKKVDEQDFPTISAVDYAYAFCKCGEFQHNYDCFSLNGISKYTMVLSSIRLDSENQS